MKRPVPLSPEGAALAGRRPLWWRRPRAQPLAPPPPHRPLGRPEPRRQWRRQGWVTLRLERDPCCPCRRSEPQAFAPRPCSYRYTAHRGRWLAGRAALPRPWERSGRGHGCSRSLCGTGPRHPETPSGAGGKGRAGPADGCCRWEAWAGTGRSRARLRPPRRERCKGYG